jgi:RimJ/RimL family protein N-acetyltransferase
MQAPGPTLETARLILRPTAAADFDGWAQMMAHEPSARFIGGTVAPAAAWRQVTGMAGAWTLQGFAMFSLIDKASGRWVGRVGPWMPHGWPGTEVGWGVHPDFAGKGYAFEAAVAAIDWAFDNLGWTEVIHCIDPDNEPSRRLAARLGSVNRGPGALPAPFEAARIDIWGQSRDDWRAWRSGRS